MSVVTESEKSIVSADKKNNKNVEASGESLVESFNKHYADYLDRYSTNRKRDEPEVVAPVEDDSSGEGLFFFDEDAEPAFSEPENFDHTENDDFSEAADVVVPDVVEDNNSETEELGVEVSEVDVEAEVDVEPASEGLEVEDFEDIADEVVSDSEEVAPAPLVDDDDEDFYFSPEDSAPIEEEDDDIGFYEPESHPKEEPTPEPVAPQQTIVEREVLREVLVVDREQARDLGYGSDRYMNETAPSEPYRPSQPAAEYEEAPAAHPVSRPSAAPANNAPSVRPTYSAPVQREVQRSVTVRDEGTIASRPMEVSRPAEKSGGFFGGLFKRNKDTVDDVSDYDANVNSYKERSRIKEEGIDSEFLGLGDEKGILSLKTQDDYDPREERRRLQHIGFEQRPHVDTAVWLEQTMIDALKMDASDLHITVDGESKDLSARIRVDGQMQDFDYITGVAAKVIMGRLKAATELSSGGSYAPEETIYEIELDGEKRKARAVLFRVEDGGEALVMRLPLTGSLRQLDELAFSDTNLQYVYDLLAMPYKLIMIAGPMGSGKTTSAHGALMHVADPTRTVWTIEDPVERRLPNLVQLEIDEENGAGFDVLLAKLLRADYNTLFLGEIRDTATASAAVRQAKAGRQVMSTIHADDNIKSMMRLIELAGDSPMSVLSAVGGIISQRLVRKLNLEWDGVDPTKKYKGRIPIHEILFVNDAIVEVMMQDRPLSEIKQAVRQAKGSTFADDAYRLLEAGVTDREEIVKVIGEFDADDRY